MSYMGFTNKPTTSGYASELDLELREEERIEMWRQEQLARLGFNETEIESLLEAGADYHEAGRLLRRGCPHVRVVEILG